MKIRPFTAAAAACLALPLSPAQAESHGDTLVVTASRIESRADELLSDVTVIGRDELAASGASSLVDVLGRQPGIQYSQSGGIGKNASIYMRGSNFGHVLVLVDGVRTGSATLGEANLPALPIEQIERIEILRGPASALYGSDAIGGVIQIFTRQGAGQGVRPSVYAGVGSDHLRRAGAAVSGGVGEWAYRLGAGYVEVDGFSARDEAVADPDRDGYRETDASGQLSWSPAKGHTVGASFLYSKGRNWFDSEYDALPANLFLNSEVSTLALYAKNQLSERWHSTLRYGRSSDDSFNRYSLWYDPSHFRTVDDQLTWQNDIRLSAGTLMLAIEHLKQSVASSNDYAQSDRELRSVLAGWTGNYGPHRIQLNLRRDDSSSFDDKTTGAFAYGFQLTDALRLSASYGTSYVAPTFNDLFWPNQTSVWFGTTYITQGNLSVKPEEGRNREFAIIWDDGQSSLSATYYLNKVRNLIDWETTMINPTTSLTTPTNVASARLEGLTLQGATRLGEVKASASIDFLKARDDETGDRLQRRADRSMTLRAERPFGALRVGAEMVASDGRYSKSHNTDWLPGYAIANVFGQYAVDEALTIEARVDNVFDKDYALIKDFKTGGVSAYLGIRYAPK